MTAAGSANPGAAGGFRALLVDPSLFTAPYDAALSEGLAANGIEPLWAVRAPRPGEACEIPAALRAQIYYRGAEGSAKTGGTLAQLRKGLSHVASSWRLLQLAEDFAPDVVHFQWAVLPIVDRPTIRRLAARRPVVVTVHDTNPFNGIPTSQLQLLGYAGLLRAADHLVVHTQRGREALLRLGCEAERLSVIPHGPLRLPVAIPPRPPTDGRWTFVLFGKLQSYKGVDVLASAMAALDPAVRGRVRVIVAGEPLMDMGGVLETIRAAGLAEYVDLRLFRHREEEMASLFSEADVFVFPYRHIEASGVYHLVKDLGKWIVASDIGCFAEELSPDRGSLTPPGDVAALAAAMAASLGRRPDAGEARVAGWTEIGGRTRAVYERALSARVGE